MSFLRGTGFQWVHPNASKNTRMRSPTRSVSLAIDHSWQTKLYSTIDTVEVDIEDLMPEFVRMTAHCLLGTDGGRIG
jgi:hypothetical protein